MLVKVEVLGIKRDAKLDRIDAFLAEHRVIGPCGHG